MTVVYTYQIPTARTGHSRNPDSWLLDEHALQGERGGFWPLDELGESYGKQVVAAGGSCDVVAGRVDGVAGGALFGGVGASSRWFLALEALAAVASAVAASAAMRVLFRASMMPLPFFFRLSAVPAGGEGAASGIGGCVGVDVERVGGAIALPCEVGDDGAGAHGVDPELVRFADDDVGVKLAPRISA